jgi:hypothetical protein
MYLPNHFKYVSLFKITFHEHPFGDKEPVFGFELKLCCGALKETCGIPEKSLIASPTYQDLSDYSPANFLVTSIKNLIHKVKIVF